MYEKLIYTNDLGDSVEISHSSLFFLESHEGLDAIKNVIHTQRSPYQDGVTEVSSNLEPRDITIRGSINATKKDEIIKHRQKLIQVFNPKLKGALKYAAGNIQREIGCTVEFAPVLPTMPNMYKKFMIQLLCSSPFWQDEITHSKEVVSWIGGLRFPLRFPTSFATKGAREANIINRGDVATPVRIEITGTVTNPQIAKRFTGDFLQVNKKLHLGDKLVITTDFGNKRVELNGENAFNWINLDSTFWQLDIGDNVIDFTSDDPTDDATIKITHKNRYVGV